MIQYTVTYICVLTAANVISLGMQYSFQEIVKLEITEITIEHKNKIVFDYFKNMACHNPIYSTSHPQKLNNPEENPQESI